MLTRRPDRLLRLLLSGAAALLVAAVAAQRPGGPGPGRGDGGPYISSVPAYAGNVILGRPTDRSVVASIMLDHGTKVRVEYGEPGHLDRCTPATELAAGEPREVALSGLEQDHLYRYRVVEDATGRQILPEAGEGSFHTQRKPGGEFTFVVQADSHLDAGCTAGLYRRTLAHEAAEEPDFLVDLGDTFMTGKIDDRDRALKQYQAQRYFLGLVGANAPIFLTIGNHDGEEAFRRGAAAPDGLAAWSCAQRKRYFPNPVPDGFYTGNGAAHPAAGSLQDYYAWTWGDALFVVLDAYWFSAPNRGGSEPWGPSLGKAQYDWLAPTLRGSKARWKFVFIHQLIGGTDSGGRGGAEASALYEWGGHETNGSDSFAQHRPGWGKPIHDLLVEAGVTVLFHGHDHFFARQTRDGLVYQLVPQPANRSYQRHQASEYGYASGDFLPNCGHLRVRAGAQGVDVSYVRTADQEMEADGISDGTSAFSYVLPARR